MAAAWSRTVAITAARDIRQGSTVLAISFLCRLKAWGASRQPGHKASGSTLRRANLQEILRRPQKGEWLLSWRPDSNSTFRIMRWQQGSERMEPVIEEPGASLLQPALIASRPVPNRHPSGLHDSPNANLLCLNAYTSKSRFAPGSIRSVRIYAQTETVAPAC